MAVRRTIPEIIDALGVAVLAREFGHANLTTVDSWKRRGSIPVARWPALIAFAERAGVALTNDDLAAAHVSEFPAEPKLHAAGVDR
jgi:hypothetical protein